MAGNSSNPQRVSDVLLSALAWTSALVVDPTFVGAAQKSTQRPMGQSVALVIVGVLGTVVVLSLRGVHQRIPRLPRVQETAAVIAATAAGMGLVAGVASIIRWDIGRAELLVGAAVFFVGRGFTSAFRDARQSRTRRQVAKTVVIGSGPDTDRLLELITEHPESGLHVHGVVNAETSSSHPRWLGTYSDISSIAVQERIELAVISVPEVEGYSVQQLIGELFDAGLDVHLSMGIDRLRQGRIGTKSLSHEPLIVLHQNDMRFTKRVVKRVIDVVGSVALLLLGLPVFLLVALAVKVESRGPIIYRSDRYGRNADHFHMLKFRSMVAEADAQQKQLADMNERSGPLFKITNDPRVTRVGRLIRKTSLDELPQLINVLRGEMSLVGPRPATTEEELQFSGEHRRRFRVRPGLTGLWQVEARSHPSFNAYRRLDLHYLDNWSLGLDFLILVTTAVDFLIAIITAPLARFGIFTTVDGVTESIDLNDEAPIIDLTSLETEQVVQGR